MELHTLPAKEDRIWRSYFVTVPKQGDAGTEQGDAETEPRDTAGELRYRKMLMW